MRIPAEQQISEVWPAIRIEAANFAIKHGAFNSKVFGDPCCKFGESSEGVSVSRDEFTLPVLDVCQGAETINLQFVDEFVRVERFRATGKPHGP